MHLFNHGIFIIIKGFEYAHVELSKIYLTLLGHGLVLLLDLSQMLGQVGEGPSLGIVLVRQYTAGEATLGRKV